MKSKCCQCLECHKLFVDGASFDKHSCCVKAAKLLKSDPREFYRKMYAYGGCDREFYERKMREFGEKK